MWAHGIEVHNIWTIYNIIIEMTAFIDIFP